MNYEFKYAKNTLDLICSILFGILGLLHFSFLILILINSTPNLFIPLLLLFVSVIESPTSILHFKMYIGHRNYLVINNNELHKDQGLIRKKKKVDLCKLRYARKVGGKIRLGLGERNELRINLDCLNIEDITKLEYVFNNSNVQL